MLGQCVESEFLCQLDLRSFDEWRGPFLPVSGPPPAGRGPGLSPGPSRHRTSGDLYLALPESACSIHGQYHTHRPGMSFHSLWNIRHPSPQLKAGTSPFLTWPDLQPAGLCPCREPSLLSPKGRNVETVMPSARCGLQDNTRSFPSRSHRLTSVMAASHQPPCSLRVSRNWAPEGGLGFIRAAWCLFSKTVLPFLQG